MRADLRADMHDPTGAELRYDRSYDEQTPSTLIHPNGSLVCSYDREFLGAAARAILDLHAQAPAPKCPTCLRPLANPSSGICPACGSRVS